MRNIEKIKQLENECGKYRKKIADQHKEIAELKDVHRQMDALHAVVDCVMAQAAIQLGEEKRDGGAVIGWTLVLEKPRADLLERYEVHANHFGGKLNIGVMPRGD